MRKQFESRKAVTIYLDEADYKWVELQSGGNVSGWCRERILAVAVIPPYTDFGGTEAFYGSKEKDIVVPLAVKPAKKLVVEEPTQKKVCRHGKEKGYHCWQCGGLALA